MATVEEHVEQEINRAENGVARAGGDIAVENPATGETVGSVPDLGAEAVAEMAARGRAAQPEWDAYGFEGRSRVMLRAQKWVMDNAPRIVATICSETGKTFEDAELMEISYAGAAFGFWAKEGPSYLADERVKSGQVLVKGKKLVLRYRPLGLIGVIGPWNYPLTNSFGDCIPALMAGNSVILKPSEITPLTSLLLAEGLRECGLPQNVLQIATGRGETGAALVEHVDMIMFTGSTRTGRKVAEAAAQRLIPASLELGGKDPMLVLADADLERAANFATYYSMQNAGQTCISIERVYVEEPVYDEFVAKVSEKVRALRVGKPEGPGTVEVGAITFAPQMETIKDHVADALAKGARVLTGGNEVQGAGRFFEPTVLVDVDHSMKCMTEETFGPTLPIMKVADADEAVRLANDSIYGLASSVFSRDAERGEAVARRLEAGATTVNDAMLNYAVLELPMGGAKASGLGSRHGAGGIRKYCSQQAILVTAKLAMKKEVFMYPYKSRTSRLLAGVFKLLYGRGKRA
jgi:acyl-CoA reductase-like NAD-dependent aldehyde dehydrogenase